MTVTHYHVRVGDAPRGGTGTALPSVKPPAVPKAAPKKPPRANPPKAPAPPKPPGPKRPSPAPAQAPVAAGRRATGLVSGINRGIAGATRLARRTQYGVEEAEGFASRFNRDSGSRDEMGHYHFNIPSRGSTMQRDYGTAEGARKRSQHQVAAENHEGRANIDWAHHGGANTGSLLHSRAAKAHRLAHEAQGKPHYQQAANAAHAASREAWGHTDRGNEAARQKFNREVRPTSTVMRQPGDSGTSEGARKAAQTRAQGGQGHGTLPSRLPLTGGSYGRYGPDIKAGSNEGPSTKKPYKREPFQGYDSRK